MFTPEELRQAKIFACLDEAECARMAQNAADVRLKAGEWLIRSGETPWFYVVYEGRLRIVADIYGIQTEFPEYDFTEGDFLGEVPLLLRTPVFNSARAQTPCRIARLDKQQFFQLIRDSKEARAMVLEVLGERLLRIQERSLSLMTARVLIFGRNKDADCHEVRVVREAGISVLFSFCDHLRLASLPIEHYDARHIIAVMIAPLQHAPEHATSHRSSAEDCMLMAHIGI